MHEDFTAWTAPTRPCCGWSCATRSACCRPANGRVAGVLARHVGSQTSRALRKLRRELAA